MTETAHFVNEGFGWECKRCRESGGETGGEGGEDSATAELPRFFREGEAEAGSPRLASDSLAQWKDESHRILRCPACGVEEEVGA